MTPRSRFDRYRSKAYPHVFTGELVVSQLAGGTPTDPKVAEGWLRTKLGLDNDDLIRDMVARTMLERGVDADQAVEQVVEHKHLNGFKRRPDGELYIEGRHLKACIKEAACIRWPGDRWGPTRKGTKSFFAEHVFVTDDILGLGVTEPTLVAQRFVHTFRGNGIQYEEVVSDATVTFTVVTDHDFTAEQWGLLWLTAEANGLGASRSQGFGTFTVTKWTKQ